MPVGAGLASARNDDIELSTAGKIIEQQWCHIPNLYNDTDLDEYVIMPNHIHGASHHQK